MTNLNKLGRFVILSLLALVLVACGTTNNPSPTVNSTTNTAVSANGKNTTVAGTAANLVVPAISDLNLVTLAPSTAEAVASKLGATIGSGTQFKLYTSATTDPTALATKIDTAMGEAGYKFAVPQLSKPFQQGNLWVGLYSKSDSPDLLTICGDPTAFKEAAQTGSSTNLDSILSGQKSVVVVVSAPNLSNSILSSPASGTASTK